MLCVSKPKARVDRWVIFKEETWRAKRWTKTGAVISSCSVAVIGAQHPLEMRFTYVYYRHGDQSLIFVFILAEFGFYVLIRQIVNAKEWLSACRPPFIINCPSPDLKLSCREGKERPPTPSATRLQDVPSKFSALVTSLYLT